VSQLQLVLAEDWKWATEETLELNWKPAANGEGVDALVVAPGPADDLETGSLYFCNAIGAAKRRVWIASPYFVPDVDVQSALMLAAIRGVDVRIVVADKRDHLFVWLAAFAYFDVMRRAWIEILRYTDGFMHQKIVLVDDTFASVGTVNLDNRSCRLNFEVTALVFDAGFARDVEAMLETDFSHSRAYVTPLDQAPSRLVRYGAPVARLLAPLL
jgi:cardiolipin synthase